MFAMHASALGEDVHVGLPLILDCDDFLVSDFMSSLYRIFAVVLKNNMLVLFVATTFKGSAITSRYVIDGSADAIGKFVESVKWHVNYSNVNVTLMLANIIYQPSMKVRGQSPRLGLLVLRGYLYTVHWEPYYFPKDVAIELMSNQCSKSVPLLAIHVMYDLSSKLVAIIPFIDGLRFMTLRSYFAMNADQIKEVLKEFKWMANITRVTRPDIYNSDGGLIDNFLDSPLLSNII